VAADRAAAGALDAVLAAVARRRRLEGALRERLEAGGYREVAVPLLQPAASGDGWEAAYRVLDQDGDILDLRPDVTGPVARLCALGDAGGPRPRRLWYQAPIFRRVPGDGAREVLQAGAERIGGDGGAAADAEVVGLLAECLEAAGARGWLLAVGHVGYAREVAARAGADPGRVAGVLRGRRLADLERVAGAAAADLAWRGDLSEALAGRIRADLPAGRRWRRVLQALDRSRWGQGILVEPGFVPPAAYYTGLVFEVLVPGSPWPVGDGGRYDELLRRWGRAEPAIGFALDCERLLQAVEGEAPAEGTRRAWAAVSGAAEALGAAAGPGARP
jgi:ATP phosphoribosyltransferase regulatory subunit